MAVVWEEVRLCEEKAVSYPTIASSSLCYFHPENISFQLINLNFLFPIFSRVDKENLRGINNLHVLEHEIFRKLLSSTAF